MVERRGDDARAHAERRRHVGHDAVDRAPLLGAAGEVDAAHDRRVLVDVLVEQVGDQIDQPLAQRIELLREGVDPLARLDAPLLAHAHDGVALEHVGQLVEVLREGLDVVVVLAGRAAGVKPQICPRSRSLRSPKVSTKPAMRSHLVKRR